jgi:glycosyltransferase involved in cell wall biosynthesis
MQKSMTRNVSYPEVSVVIPTYNRATSIVRSLESLRAQTFNEWECIVVDDGSTDNTSEVLEHFCTRDDRFSFYKRGTDRKKGANACRNIGIEHARGNFITFLDSDDEYLPNHIQDRLTHLKSSNADGSYGAAFVFNGVDRKKTTSRDRRKDESWFNFVLENFVGTPFLLLKANIVRETKFDEGLLRHQDWDFLMRLRPDVNVVHYPEPTFVINYVKHEKRNIHFDSCINVYERHKSQLVYKNSVKGYLFNMYEKAVNYDADESVIRYYKDEVIRNFDEYSLSEKYKLSFPRLYRNLRKIYLAMRGFKID